MHISSYTAIRRLLIAALILPLLGLFAESASASTSDDEQVSSPPGGRERDPALKAEAERRVRAYRAVALAEYLELDEEEALAINAVITRFDRQRNEAQERIIQHMRVLRRAAEESDPDPEMVSAAIDGVLAARSRLEEIRQEEAREILARLDPVRQARLLVFFGEFPRDVRRLMQESRRRRPDLAPDRSMDGPPRPGPRRKGL